MVITIQLIIPTQVWWCVRECLKIAAIGIVNIISDRSQDDRYIDFVGIDNIDINLSFQLANLFNEFPIN